jgi:hypothetical protein
VANDITLQQLADELGIESGQLRRFIVKRRDEYGFKLRRVRTGDPSRPVALALAPEDADVLRHLWHAQGLIVAGDLVKL